jgi:hypothetical protein
MANPFERMVRRGGGRVDQTVRSKCGGAWISSGRWLEQGEEDLGLGRCAAEYGKAEGPFCRASGGRI